MNRNLIFAGAALTILSACTEKESKQVKPNIVYILADDLGYGELSCFGQKKFNTPNIDELAKEGMLFTQHYSGSSVSAPSRSSLITGLHTGHTPVRGNKEAPNNEEGQYPMPGDTYSVIKLLKEQGYTTGVFGKWGLGGSTTESAPHKQGVDEFYGYNCQRLAHHYYPYHLWDNDKKVELKGNIGKEEKEYAPYLIHDKAIEFINENKDQPFFLFYTSVLPHAEMLTPEKEMEPFRGKLLPEKNFKGCDDGPKFRQGPYRSQKECHAAQAAMITLLDKQVGDIVAQLEKDGLMENTIIIFTSDNGPSAEGGSDPEFFNSSGPLRGVKRDLYEGGIRVPYIVKWQNKIAEGSKSEHISAFWDFLPTIAEILDVELSVATDGISYLPTLLGEKEQKQHEYLYWEFHERDGRIAVRMGDWKGVIYNLAKGGKMQLYNLKDDIGETTNLATQHPEIVAQIQDIMKNARTESEIFQFALPTYNAE